MKTRKKLPGAPEPLNVNESRISSLSDPTSRLVTPEAGAARLWAFLEDELRLVRENGLDRQIVPVDGAEVLADVARLGMVGLYYRTDGGAVGLAEWDGAAWGWRRIESRDEQKAVEALFEKMKHGVRSGAFTLPGPHAGGRP